MDIQYKNLVETFSLFHGILEHYLKDNSALEFFFCWGPNYEATWELRNKAPEETIFSYFARIRRSLKDWYK